MIERPYYEVVIRLPLDLYDEDWFDCVAAAAGDNAAVSGDVVPEFPPSISSGAPRPIPYQGLLRLPLTRCGAYKHSPAGLKFDSNNWIDDRCQNLTSGRYGLCEGHSKAALGYSRA